MSDIKTSRKNSSRPADKKLFAWGTAAAGAALVGAALVNRQRAKKAEEQNPPLGEFIEVDGVRLHYLERGEGSPIVLLHGNGTMIEDWLVSGLFDTLAKTNRVIAFDRPGFGHSERPRSRIWTPEAQAALFVKAFGELGIDRPLVVGHSLGATITAALAVDHPHSLSGAVLIGGYFYPSLRPDVLLGVQPAIPVVGDIMRYTVSPLIGAAMMPAIHAQLFAPAGIDDAWEREFPHEMVLRPSQIRAEAAEAGLMVPAAAALAGRLAEINAPVTIVAGDGDKIVSQEDQSKRLHEALPTSRLVLVEEAGHMVHHTAPKKVIAAILEAAR
jgi:pimeloyl-ACP methyl ester carboxylesterase